MKNIRVWPIIIFVILVGVFVFTQSSPIKNQASMLRETAKVSKVVDGDTVEASLNNKKEIIRLIGIDAPETVYPKMPAQCFGQEASNKAREILSGKTIILESDPTQGDRDEYGRLLRYVFLQDGTNFNKFMISEGYAHEYTFKGSFYKYQSEFKDTGVKAQENKKGLWADGICD